MAFNNWYLPPHLPLLLGIPSFLLLLLPCTTTVVGIRSIITRPSLVRLIFNEEPSFRNGNGCGCKETDIIHIAITLDANYLRGTMATILSLLKHTTCPENLSFHFLSVHSEPELSSCINSNFPYLHFKIYHLDCNSIRGKISRSIRQALDQPLNYARIYLADIIPYNVRRIIYLDSDLIVVDDIAKLWSVDTEDKVVAAPEYCNADFALYLTNIFWSDPKLAKSFEGRNPCYFNTGVVVMDVNKWRKEKFKQRVEEWMAVQKQKRIYHLGSLPPFLLVLAGNIKPVDHR